MIQEPRDEEKEKRERQEHIDYINKEYGSIEKYEAYLRQTYEKQREEDNIIKVLKERQQIRNDALKPKILLPHTGKLISQFIKDITPILIENRKIYYRPEEDTIITIKKENNTTTFQPLQALDLITYLEEIIEPGIMIPDQRLKIPVFKSKSIGIELAKIILASTELKNNLPKIRIIYNVPQPILKDGKLIFPRRGYDLELESYQPEESPIIKTDMQLEEAKKIINSIYDEFCFKSSQDKVNAIAGLLTPYIRGLYSRATVRTPVFFYDANRERAGKDYCASITSLVHYGEAIDQTPISDEKGVHDEEFRKKILSTFRLGKRRFHSSNNKGYINSAELESVTTNENFSDRVLGTNTVVNYKNNMEFSLSANSGITYTPDLANRSIFVHLFLELEDPNKRRFSNPDLHKWVLDNRESILSSLYCFVRVWYESGCKASEMPFTSFPEWAKICGGIMEACELGNPCETNDDTFNIGGDSETKDMKKLFELCFDKFKINPETTDWTLKKDIVQCFKSELNEDEGFKELFVWLDWFKSGTDKRFGKLFEKYVGRVFSDIKLIRQENAKTERRTYKFVKVSGGFGGFGGQFDIPVIKMNNLKIHNTIEKTPETPKTPSSKNELLITWSDVQSMLLDKSLYEMKVDDLISYGVSENQLEQWKSEGLIFESRNGFVRLL